MKNIAYIVSFLLSLSILVSCDDMLETKNYTDMVPSNFFQSEKDFNSALIAIYRPCTVDWGYTDGGTGQWRRSLFNADKNTYLIAGDLSTDILRSYKASDEYEHFQVRPSTGGPIEEVYYVIRFVAKATDVINRIQNSSGATEEIRNRYIAEAKTLRAFYMYVLLDWFGPVCVKLDPSTLFDNTIVPRPSYDDYIGYIESDLNDAVNTASFPDKYNDSPENWGRMSKSIAYAIQMRLYMHEKNWAKVKEVTENKLMKMGFSIIENYKDLFIKSCTSEHIWSIPANSSLANYYVVETLPDDFKRGFNHKGWVYQHGDNDNALPGWAAFCMRWEFYDTFEDNDVRKETILCEYETIGGQIKNRANNNMVGPIGIKFTDNTGVNSTGISKEQPIIRYAEVLLSYAEAENELNNGPTPAAIDAVTQVTGRANTTIPASALVDRDSFRSFLLAERGRELFGEGQRRQDLIRHDEYIKRAKERGDKAEDYQVLYPIPQYVITEAGGVIEQNSGY